MKKTTTVVSIFAAFCVVLSVAFWAKIKIQQGGQAYIYGYPILLMNATKGLMLSGGSTLNQFTHSQVFPDHRFRNVVRPNNDTLYSVAWLDLSEQPVVLSVPDTQGRYYVMPLMDSATNVFATIGKRETGTQAGDYVITGPNWEGETIVGAEHIQAPTKVVWLIGRIQTNGMSDIPNVRALQNQFKLASTKDYSQGRANKAYVKPISQSDALIDPNLELEALTLAEFLEQLGQYIQGTQVPKYDLSALKNLENLGVSKHHGFDPNETSAIEEWLFGLGFEIAKNRLTDKINAREFTENGWAVLRSGIGNYGVNYSMRAAVAKVGLGALPPAEAAYPNANIDASGQQLSGARRYVLRFDADQLPPVKAFWSLSMYDSSGFFIDNPIKRYSIGSRDKLNFTDDGSLEIVIQENEPDEENTNWLPSPNDDFSLTLRLYLPTKSFLDGTWRLPPIERLDE